jgi:vancomycin aglycone glucosyltransferase
LSTYDSRGGIEPLAALGGQLRDLGAEAVVCAPPDCAERLAEVGLPLVPVGEPVRQLVHGAKPPSEADVPRIAAELMATWFSEVAAAAVARTIRTDGAAVAANLLSEAVSLRPVGG